MDTREKDAKKKKKEKMKAQKKGKKERIENRCAINTTSVEVR